MRESVGKALKGGCQCGAVRFEVAGTLGTPSICHCRMCQKAFGNYFAPLVNMGEAKLTWLKAEPKRFQSSNWVKRGFCPDCGTPLTYESPNGSRWPSAPLTIPIASNPSTNTAWKAASAISTTSIDGRRNAARTICRLS